MESEAQVVVPSPQMWGWRTWKMALATSIMAARKEGGNFTSIYDFCERVDLSAVNRRMIESFIKAGALDSLGGARAQLFAVIDGAME